jgi:hypothetical protein
MHDYTDVVRLSHDILLVTLTYSIPYLTVLYHVDLWSSGVGRVAPTTALQGDAALERQEQGSSQCCTSGSLGVH